MAEKRVELKVRTFKVTKICDKCNKGEMKRINSNIYLTTYPEQYQHECVSCGNKENYFTSYPKIEYEYEEIQKGE